MGINQDMIIRTTISVIFISNNSHNLDITWYGSITPLVINSTYSIKIITNLHPRTHNLGINLGITRINTISIIARGTNSHIISITRYGYIITQSILCILSVNIITNIYLRITNICMDIPTSSSIIYIRTKSQSLAITGYGYRIPQVIKCIFSINIIKNL